MDNKDFEIILISHTEHSTMLDPSSVPKGEVNNALKLWNLLTSNGYQVANIQDYHELFGIHSMEDENAQVLESLKKLNIDLAIAGEEMIEESNTPCIQSFLEKISKRTDPTKETILFLLTWHINSLPVIATGIHHRFPLVGKSYCNFPGEYTYSGFPYLECYQGPDLLICESLLAAIEGIRVGLPPWKFMYLPHISPPEAVKILALPDEEKASYKERYIQQLAQDNKKDIHYDEDTVVIGYPVRFARRKNVEMLIEAVSELRKSYPNLLLVLKGDYDPEGDFRVQYSDKLSMLMRAAEKEPWFLWDRSFTPYPEVLRIFSCFDICAYISGAESGNNTIIEVASLGVPCIVLNASTCPYMYKDMACFVEAGNQILGVWIYQQPDLKDLKEKLAHFIKSPEERRQFGEKARQIAAERYGAHKTFDRMSLLLEAVHSLHHKDQDFEKYKNLLLEQLHDDLMEYGLDPTEILHGSSS
ncbi:MAG: glycosyltransferase involved in cell wall biosynthesis [Chlamydiales bacterium]|jgi:glycosyltransferase involved in cell wall biosynthesis